MLIQAAAESSDRYDILKTEIDSRVAAEAEAWSVPGCHILLALCYVLQHFSSSEAMQHVNICSISVCPNVIYSLLLTELCASGSKFPLTD